MGEPEALDAAIQPAEEDSHDIEDEKMEEVQNPGSDAESDSDTDSDSDDENETKAQIEALESELHNNAFNYDTHVQYIKALRKHGDIEKLRLARESMSSLFPLSPEMWQEWAKDEVIIRTGNEAISEVESIYERGVTDYLSVSLWCDYLDFVQEYDPSVRECSISGVSKARNLFERALTAAGLHVTEGHKIWEMYREFEQAVFLTIPETDHQAKVKQIQRIRNLFHRQFSVPNAELESTLLAYKAWEANIEGSADGQSAHVMSGYQKALQMYNARAHFEELISKEEPDSQKFQSFTTYLKFEHSFGDPARIQILYECAIAKFPVSADLWVEYTQYLDKTFKIARIVREAYHRATRNCSWVGDLWVRYLLSLERSRCSEEELSTVFERALQCTFSSYEEYLNIFLTRVDGLRRRISSVVQAEDGVSYASIRDVFQRASEYLAQNLNDDESFIRLHSYWSRLEIKLGKDLIAARGVWESLLKIHGTVLEAWQGYISMEIESGHINEARSLYKRCYTRKFAGTGSEDICHSWLRFEREYGSLDEFDVAVQKVSPRLQELQLLRLQQESKNVAVTTYGGSNSSKGKVPEKRKPAPDLSDADSPSKRRKTMPEKSKKIKENDREEGKQSAEAKEASELDVNKTEASGTVEVKENPQKKLVRFNDDCTVFISNLNLKATDDDLRSFFADVGGVVAIRILKDKFTRESRGLAYVDFSDNEHLAAALEKNKHSLLGKKLSVLKSDPQQGSKKKAGNRETRPEQRRMDAKETHKGRREPRIETQSQTPQVQLKGKNTFAVPRNVKPLGWSSSTKPTPEADDEGAKSNEEFRNMFLKRSTPEN